MAIADLPSTEELKNSIIKHLHGSLGTDVNKASPQAWWRATCAAVNEYVYDGLRNTQRTHYQQNTRAVHYFSLEYLMGRLFSNNLHNLGVYDAAKDALAQLGLNIADLEDQEEDMALGNGGLGRLAACFIDSMATLNYPAIGYGIHYEHGLFKQEFPMVVRLSVRIAGANTVTHGRFAVLNLFRKFQSTVMSKPPMTCKAK